MQKKNRERDKQERILKEVSLYPNESETGIGKYLFVDTGTTGIPKDYDGDVYDVGNWPRVVQLAWMLVDEDGKLVPKTCPHERRTPPWSFLSLLTWG